METIEIIGKRKQNVYEIVIQIAESVLNSEKVKVVGASLRLTRKKQVK